MNFPVLVLVVVLVLIAARRIGGIRIAIWQAMTGGAVAVLVSGHISPQEAWRAIDKDVMVFLFAMFVIGEALLRSGALYAATYRVLAAVPTADGLLLGLLVVAGLASALLMNDTLALVGAPLMLRLAVEHGMRPQPLLLALAFAVTTGSVMSPIGNPQNLLIAVRGPVEAPFFTFLQTLAVPTLINLLIAYVLLRVVYRRDFGAGPLTLRPVIVADPVLARLAWVSVGLLLAAAVSNIVLVTLGRSVHLPLSAMAVLGALPLLLSRRRGALLRGVEWTTLLLFAAMFVLTASVWQSPVVRHLLEQQVVDPASLPTVMAAGLFLSQLISNVPLVVLYLPLLEAVNAGEGPLLALAAASTLAGNMLIFGAASNLIILQRAERDGVRVGFWEFTRVGTPLALINCAVYWYFLA